MDIIKFSNCLRVVGVVAVAVERADCRRLSFVLRQIPLLCVLQNVVVTIVTQFNLTYSLLNSVAVISEF